MKKMVILTTLLAGGTAVALVSAAQPGPGGRSPAGKAAPGGRHALPLARILQDRELCEKLDITEEQVERLKAAVYETRKEAISLRAEVELARLELHSLMAESSADESPIMAAVDAVGRARTALQKAQVSSRLRVRAILGEETVEKLRAELRERARRHREAQRQRQPGMRGGDAPPGRTPFPTPPRRGWGAGNGPFGPGVDGEPLDPEFGDAEYDPFAADPGV